VKKTILEVYAKLGFVENGVGGSLKNLQYERLKFLYRRVIVRTWLGVFFGFVEF